MALWPDVAARLVEVVPSLPGFEGVPVFDGRPITNDPLPRYVAVGFISEDEPGGTYEQEQTAGYPVWERGTVRVLLVAQTGDGDLPGVRAQAFALLDALLAYVNADQTLGGVLTDEAVVHASSVDVLPVYNERGTAQTLIVNLSYQTRT